MDSPFPQQISTQSPGTPPSLRSLFLCQYAWSDLILPPIPTMYYAASWDAKITAPIIHCLYTKIWGQISWGDSAENQQGVVFLPGDSLLHLGRSKLPEVLFQSRHEVQQSGVKTCVVERSFKPSDEVSHLVSIQVNLHKLCHYLNIHHTKVVLLSYVHLVATKSAHILGKMSPLPVDYSTRITNSKNMSLLSGPIPFFHLPTFWLIKISRVATGCPTGCNMTSIDPSPGVS